MNQREILRSVIKSTNGLFFTILFTTKKGEERRLTMKDGVESYKVFPKGVGSNNQEHCDNLITLFDVQAGRYKSVNLDTVSYIKCGDFVWNKGD